MPMDANDNYSNQNVHDIYFRDRGIKVKIISINEATNR